MVVVADGYCSKEERDSLNEVDEDETGVVAGGGVDVASSIAAVAVVDFEETNLRLDAHSWAVDSGRGCVLANPACLTHC